MAIRTFLATYDGHTPPAYSHEHKELVLVTPGEVDTLTMPQDYKTSMRKAVNRGHFARP